MLRASKAHTFTWAKVSSGRDYPKNLDKLSVWEMSPSHSKPLCGWPTGPFSRKISLWHHWHRKLQNSWQGAGWGRKGKQNAWSNGSIWSWCLWSCESAALLSDSHAQTELAWKINEIKMKRLLQFLESYFLICWQCRALCSMYLLQN